MDAHSFGPPCRCWLKYLISVLNISSTRAFKVKTLAAKVFWPPVPVASPSREGVAGIRLLLQRLPVPIGPNHPSFLSFQPELPPVLDCPLLAKGAAVAMVCGCCCCVNMEAAKAAVPPILFMPRPQRQLVRPPLDPLPPSVLVKFAQMWLRQNLCTANGGSHKA
ncbi:hypothetical protein M9H77_13037 [Catharanthus roseus]|uniref:Uncharacterized protein n=1 Tax=Catharanthus roseus TaxID=4058 RepID=A0ACC0BJ96_CATRO|nr:hypothetical protein M9H77_13037 [Catharanthus roseus]